MGIFWFNIRLVDEIPFKISLVYAYQTHGRQKVALIKSHFIALNYTLRPATRNTNVA